MRNLARMAALLAVGGCTKPLPPPSPISGTTPPTSAVTATPPAPVDRWIISGVDNVFAIAHVESDRVVVANEVVIDGAYAWLDARTFVAFQFRPFDEDRGATGVRFDRYVDGKRVDKIAVSAAEFPTRAIPAPLLTTTGEVWLSRCADGGRCQDGDFLRVWPGPRITRGAPPPDVREFSTSYDVEVHPAPPTAAAPPSIAVVLGPVDVTVKDPYSRPIASRVERHTGAICTRDNQRVTYPEWEWASEGFTTGAQTVRWVSTTPPIFEFGEDIINPADIHHVHTTYAVACEPAFDAFVWLGDDRWASFAMAAHDPPTGDPPRLDGTWTFHAGSAVIGTLHGGPTLSGYAPPSRKP